MAPIRGYSGPPNSSVSFFQNNNGNSFNNRVTPSHRLLTTPVIHAPKPVQTSSLKAEHGGLGLIFVGSSKNTGACWGSGAVASNHHHPIPAPASTAAESNRTQATGIGKTGMGPRNDNMSEPPSFHEKCDSSHSTAASSHESDPAHSEHSRHNNDEDSNRRIRVPPNRDAWGALHHDDNNHHADSGEKLVEPNQHLVKNSEARSEPRVHRHNTNIQNNFAGAQEDDDDSADLPQHDPGNSPRRHDHRHQNDVQQFFSPPRPSHVSQNAMEGELSNRRFFESQESQAVGASSVAADVLVRVYKPPSQHPVMEQQYTYQKEAYKFETPPLDDTLDDVEKERRRRALAQEQQQMILQQVQAAREANKKASSRASDKKSSSSSSYHAPSHNVIHNKRPAPTTSSSTRNASTTTATTTTTAPTAREATTAKSIILPPHHPILTKSPNPRTKGKLYQRLPDGTVAEAPSKGQPQHACNGANETVSCEGILALKEEILEEEDTCSDYEAEDQPILENALASEATPKSHPSNAWHRGPPSGMLPNAAPSKPDNGCSSYNAEEMVDHSEQVLEQNFVALLRDNVASEDEGNDTEIRKRNQRGRPSLHFHRGKQSRPRDGGIPRDGDDRRPARKPDSDVTKTNKNQGGRHFGKPVNGQVVNRHGAEKSSHGKVHSRHHPRPQNPEEVVGTATNEVTKLIMI